MFNVFPVAVCSLNLLLSVLSNFTFVNVPYGATEIAAPESIIKLFLIFGPRATGMSTVKTPFGCVIKKMLPESCSFLISHKSPLMRVVQTALGWPTPLQFVQRWFFHLFFNFRWQLYDGWLQPHQPQIGGILFPFVVFLINDFFSSGITFFEFLRNDASGNWPGFVLKFLIWQISWTDSVFQLVSIPQ